jgi:hypothetical protein
MFQEPNKTKKKGYYTYYEYDDYSIIEWDALDGSTYVSHGPVEYMYKVWLTIQDTLNRRNPKLAEKTRGLRTSRISKKNVPYMGLLKIRDS